MSPSLGWLQAFLSAADCAAGEQDFARAGDELGLSAQGLWLRVQKLEQWLNKILIFEDPIELNEADCTPLIHIASEVLNRFEAVCSGDNFSITGLAGAQRTKLISKVRLHDLERFLALATEGTFKGAADVSRCDVATLHRTIKDLEKATESQLVAGRVSVGLTDAGEAFKDAASFIVKSLNDFRAVIPDHYDPAIPQVVRIYKLLLKRQAELQKVIELIENKGRKQRGRVRLVDAYASLNFLNDNIEKIEVALSEPSAADYGADC